MKLWSMHKIRKKTFSYCKFACTQALRHFVSLQRTSRKGQAKSFPHLLSTESFKVTLTHFWPIFPFYTP